MQAEMCLSVRGTINLCSFPPFHTLPDIYLMWPTVDLPTIPFAIVSKVRLTRLNVHVVDTVSLNDPDLANNTVVRFPRI